MNNKKITTVVSNIFISFIILAVSVFCLLPSAEPAFKTEQITPYYHGDRNKNSVAIMFNVYENTANVNKIIDIAKNCGAKFTFFVGGCWADDNTSCLNAIVNGGHLIGNHGYFHKDHKKLSYYDNKQEIENTNKVIKALADVDCRYFAPPSGSFGENTLKVCFDMQQNVIMWTKDTIDWRDHDVSLITSRAIKDLKGGDFILMHPTNESVLALPDILQCILNAGLKADTVENTI